MYMLLQDGTTATHLAAWKNNGQSLEALIVAGADFDVSLTCCSSSHSSHRSCQCQILEDCALICIVCPCILALQDKGLLLPVSIWAVGIMCTHAAASLPACQMFLQIQMSLIQLPYTESLTGVSGMTSCNVLQTKNEIGQTPLHEAANQGHAKIVEKLLQEGADARSRDKVIAALVYWFS